MGWILLWLAGTVAPPPAPRPVEVPQALLRVTSVPELSGIAWSRALNRYLVVSDDTGREDRGNRHVPIVVALDGQGRLDGAPIPVEGIDALNDAESICAGPDGTFFILTSHSPNKNAKIAKARRKLLHVALDARKRRLRVLGQLDLVTDAGASPVQARLGLPMAPLDLEAVEFREGSLYIGLKAPLADDGRAVVAKLENAVGVVHAGQVPPGALTRFATLPLCFEHEGQRVCQGVADLRFLADGSLVLLGNAPRGGGHDGGGAVWLARKPVADAVPELLAHFRDLKPEGVTIRPDGKKLVVVFDRDGEQPEWTELPLPGPKPGEKAQVSAR